MAGTRTAPAVNGTPAYKDVSLHWVDRGGQKRSDSYQFDVTMTNAEAEAFAAAMQALSNGSLWKVGVADAYSSVPQASNAVAGLRSSGDDVINILQKTPLNVAQDIVVRSPMSTLFVGDTQVIDVATNAALFGAAATAFQAAASAGYTTVSYRFSEHREIGKRQFI